MSNELFRRLQLSSPELAREVARSQEAMEAIRLLENGRLVADYAKALKKEFPFIMVGVNNAGV